MAIICLLATPFDLSAVEGADLVVTGYIGRTPGVNPKSRIGDYQVDTTGNFALAYTKERKIRIVSQENKLLREQQVPFEPHYIAAAPDGGCYVAGSCTKPTINVVRYDANGTELLRLDPTTIPWPKETTTVQRQGTSQVKTHGEYVYVGFNYGGKHTHSKEMLVRFDQKLQNPTVIVEDCMGCCGHVPMAIADDGTLFISDSSIYRIRKFNPKGQRVAVWKRPYNRNYDPRGLCPDGKGGIYALTGNGAIEHQDGQGKLLGQIRPNCDFNKLEPVVRTRREQRFVRETGRQWWSTRRNTSQAWCTPCYVPMAMLDDGKRIAVLDTGKNVIRIFSWQIPTKRSKR